MCTESIYACIIKSALHQPSTHCHNQLCGVENQQENSVKAQKKQPPTTVPLNDPKWSSYFQEKNDYSARQEAEAALTKAPKPKALPRKRKLSLPLGRPAQKIKTTVSTTKISPPSKASTSRPKRETKLSFKLIDDADKEFTNSSGDEYAPTTKATKKRATCSNTVKDPMDLCQICNDEEPHGSPKTIQWVECAKGCGKWYHKNCLPVIYRHMPDCLINYKCSACEKDSRKQNNSNLSKYYNDFM